MRYLLTPLAALLIGCATPTTIQVVKANLPDGIWIGAFELQRMQPGQAIRSEATRMLLAVCSGQVRLWSEGEDGRFKSSFAPYQVESEHGSHLVRFIQSSALEKPGWVEMRSVLLVAVGTETLNAYFTRAVSNPGEPADDKWRYYFDYGSGTFKQTSDKCDAKMVSTTTPPLAP